MPVAAYARRIEDAAGSEMSGPAGLGPRGGAHDRLASGWRSLAGRRGPAPAEHGCNSTTPARPRRRTTPAAGRQRQPGRGPDSAPSPPTSSSPPRRSCRWWGRRLGRRRPRGRSACSPTVRPCPATPPSLCAGVGRPRGAPSVGDASGEDPRAGPPECAPTRDAARGAYLGVVRSTAPGGQSSARSACTTSGPVTAQPRRDGGRGARRGRLRGAGARGRRGRAQRGAARVLTAAGP